MQRVMVRTFESHGRGPKALTDGEGRFVLRGVDPGDAVFAYAPGWTARAIVEEYEPSLPLRIVLREGDRPDGGRFDENTEEVPVRVRIVDAESGEPVYRVGWDLVRQEDARRFGGIRRDEEDDLPTEAPPGRYLLRVGSAVSSHGAPEREVRVTGDGRELTIRAARRPRLEIDAEGLPEDAEIGLVAGNAVHEPDGHLAAGVPATVRVSAFGIVRFFPVGPAKDGVRRATIAWPKPKRVRSKLGERSSLDLPDVRSRKAGETVIETHASGPTRLLVTDDGLGYQLVRIELPSEPGAEVVVPESVLRPPGTLTVLLPDGRPAAEARVAGGPGQSGLPLDGEGRAVSRLLRAGVHVTVRADGFDHPLRRRLEGDGPWTLRFGDAALKVEAEGVESFALLLDGILHATDDGALRLAGLEPGAHLLLVSARSRGARALRVVLAKGATRRLRVDLPD